jgi:hypothetical protein
MTFDPSGLIWIFLGMIEASCGMTTATKPPRIATCVTRMMTESTKENGKTSGAIIRSVKIISN